MMTKPAAQPPHVGTPSQAMTVASDTMAFKLALEPGTFEAVEAIATRFAKIGFCGAKNAEEALARILFGRALGLPLIQSMQLIYIVNGRPGTDASLMRALCINHPACEYFECSETTPESATFRAKRRGGSGKEQTITWTIEDAKRAKLADKDNWRNYPADMLRARATASLARLVFPDAIAGLYLSDEIDTIETVGVDVTDRGTAGVIETAVATSAGTAPPARDFRAEADALKERIAKKPDGANGKALRDECKAWDADARAFDPALADEVRSFYGMIYSAKPNGEAKPSSAAEDLGRIAT